jgi:hypothetical protein
MPKIKLDPSKLLGFDQAAAMVAKVGFKKPSPSPPPPPPARS